MVEGAEAFESACAEAASITLAFVRLAEPFFDDRVGDDIDLPTRTLQIPNRDRSGEFCDRDTQRLADGAIGHRAAMDVQTRRRARIGADRVNPSRSEEQAVGQSSVVQRGTMSPERHRAYWRRNNAQRRRRGTSDRRGLSGVMSRSSRLDRSRHRPRRPGASSRPALRG